MRTLITGILVLLLSAPSFAQDAVIEQEIKALSKA